MESVDRLRAAAELGRLAVWAQLPLRESSVADSAAQEALRGLRLEHEGRPRRTTVAWAEAVAVLERFRARAVFEAWSREGWSAANWPTSDSRRLRAV